MHFSLNKDEYGGVDKGQNKMDVVQVPCHDDQIIFQHHGLVFDFCLEKWV